MMQNHKLIKTFALMLALILTTGIIGPPSIDIFSLTAYAAEDDAADAKTMRDNEGKKNISEDIDYFNSINIDTSFAFQIQMATNYGNRMYAQGVPIGGITNGYAEQLNMSNIAPFWGYTDGEVETDSLDSPENTRISKSSDSSVTYDRSIFFNPVVGSSGSEVYRAAAYYVNYGLMLKLMGFDAMGAAQSDTRRPILGGIALISYYAASSVNVLFSMMYDVLIDTNPFQFFSQIADDVTTSAGKTELQNIADESSSAAETTGVAPLIKFFSDLYTVFVRFSWAVAVPLSILFIIVAFFLSRSGRTNFWSNTKKLLIRIIFLVVGIPILGSAYTQVLKTLSDANAMSDDFIAQAVSYTFLDFGEWVENSRLDPNTAKGSDKDYSQYFCLGYTRDIKDGVMIVGDGMLGAATWLNLRQMCTTINENNGVFDLGTNKYLTVMKGTGSLQKDFLYETNGATLSTETANKGIDIDTRKAVLTVIEKYMRGEKYTATMFQTGVIGSLAAKVPNYGDLLALSCDKYSFSQNAERVVHDLQVDGDYYDSKGATPGKNYGKVATERFGKNGTSFSSWGEDGNIWNNGTITRDNWDAAGGHASYSSIPQYGDQFKSSVTLSSSTATGKKGSDLGLQPKQKTGFSTMAMFTYLTTDFGQKNVTVYGGAPSVYTQNAHYSVNLIGGNYVMQFAFFANMIAIMLGYFALAVMYAFRTVFDIIFKGFTLMGHALLAAAGFYRSIGTCICMVINMIAQLFMCTVFFSLMVDLMFMVASMFDHVLYNLFNTLLGNTGSGGHLPLDQSTMYTFDASRSFEAECMVILSSLLCAFVIVFFVSFAIRWRAAIMNSINSMVERLLSTLLGEQLSGASEGYMGGMAMAALSDATNIAKGAAAIAGGTALINEASEAINDVTGESSSDATSDVEGENADGSKSLDELAEENEANRNEAAAEDQSLSAKIGRFFAQKGEDVDPYSGTTLTPEQAEAYRNMSPEEQNFVKGIESDEARKAYLQDAVEKGVAAEADELGAKYGWSDEEKEKFKSMDKEDREKYKAKEEKAWQKAQEKQANAEEDMPDETAILSRNDSAKSSNSGGSNNDTSDTGDAGTNDTGTEAAANTEQETAEATEADVAAAGTESTGVVSSVSADENGDTLWLQTNPETGTKTGAKFDPTRGLVFATENADGTVSDVAVGLNGISVGSIDADGNNSVTTIGENGMTTNYTGADGTTETVDATFDGVNSGVQVTRTDADGNVETSVADVNGVTTQKMEKTADGSTKVTTLNPNGTTTVEESNAATGYHSVEEIAADNSSVKTEQLGNTTISTATDANGNVTDQTIVGVDSTGQAYSQSYSVDENGDITESTSKNGVTLSEVTHADGSRDEIQRTFRTDGTIAEVKTSYEPGASEGVQTSQLLAADGTTVLQTGEVSTGSDENGEYTVTSYETAAGRFEAKEYSSGKFEGQTVTTDYDKVSGGLTTTVDDGKGNLTITTSNANDPDAGSIEYKVDKKGNVTYTTTTPDGNVIAGGELAADANGVVNIEKAGGSGVIAIGTVGSGGDKETVISQDYAAGGSSIVSTNIKSGNSTSTFTDAAGAETVQSYDAKTQAVNTTYTDIVGNYGHSEQLADGTFNDSVQIAGGGSRTVQRVVSGDNIIETASTVGLAGNTQTITSTNGDVTKIEAQSASGSYVQERDSDGIIHISQVTAGGDKITKTVQTNGDYLADTVYSNGSTSHISSVGGEVTSYGTSVTGVETSSVQNGSNMSETVKYASMQTVNTLSQGSSTKTFVTSAGQAFTVVNDGDGDKTIMDMGNGNTASYKHNPDGSNTVIVHNANGSGLTEMIDANGNSQIIYTDTKGNVVRQPTGYDTINMQIAEAAKQAMPIAAATTAAFVVGQQTADFRTTAQAQDMYINSIYAGSAGTNLNLGAAPTGVVYNTGVNGVMPNGTAYVPRATGVLPNENVQYVAVPGAAEPIAPDVLAASVANTSNITTNTLKRSSTSTSMYEKLFNNLMNNNQTSSDTVIDNETDNDGDTSDPKTTDNSHGQYGENKYDVTGSASDSSNNNGK